MNMLIQRSEAVLLLVAVLYVMPEVQSKLGQFCIPKVLGLPDYIL